MHVTTAIRSVRDLCALLLVLVLPLATARAATPEEEAQMVVLENVFGRQSGPTSIGELITQVEPGQRFMYRLQSPFESGLSGYTTDTVVTFPASVIPRVDVYPSPFVQVVGNTVQIHHESHGGVGINLPFDVKAEADLPAGATEIRMTTQITVVTVNSGTLQNSVQDAISLVRDTPFTATVTAAPAEVQLTDPNAVITLTVSFENTGDDTLMHVAPFGDPIPSVADAVEPTGGPTPPSIDLAAGASGALTYTYKPKKAGPVRFSFERFLAESPSGVVEAPAAQSNEVAIKEDVSVEVTVEPPSIATDSTTAAMATIRIKATDPAGDPVAGQQVGIDFPQYLGVIDLNPRFLICGADGAIAFPPGVDPTLNDAAYGVTPASGEVAFQLRLGTQRRADQLLVLGTAFDANKVDVAEDDALATLGPFGGAPPLADNYTELSALQSADPPAVVTATGTSVVPRGTPFEVLAALVKWLQQTREKGAPLLHAWDWVPIATVTDTHAGLLIYDRKDLAQIIAHFDTGAPVAGAYVLQIELEPPLAGIRRHEVKWDRRWISLYDWENTPLDDQGLPLPPGSDIPRLRAKPAIDRVTGSPYAFLGYPYPAASAEGYGASCVPRLHGVAVTQHSPVTLLVHDAAGRAIGFDANGVFVNDVPGAVYSGGEPAAYLLPPGSYQAEIHGTDKGAASLVLSAPGAQPKTFTMKAKAGRTGTLTFDDTLASASGTFDKKKLKVADGVPIVVTGVKKKVKIRSGDPLTLTVTSAFGTPVAGARVHATGKAFDAVTLTGVDGVATMPLVVTKATKKLTVTIDGAGVQPKTLKLKVKLLKS